MSVNVVGKVLNQFDNVFAHSINSYHACAMPRFFVRTDNDGFAMHCGLQCILRTSFIDVFATNLTVANKGFHYTPFVPHGTNSDTNNTDCKLWFRRFIVNCGESSFVRV